MQTTTIKIMGEVTSGDKLLQQNNTKQVEEW